MEESELDERQPSPKDFAGQGLFIRGEDWHHNAMLNWSGFPWDTYILGYKEAADAVTQAIVERRASLDTSVFPMVFLYRQAIELKLKQLVQYTRELNNKELLTKFNHRLKPLWDELKSTLAEMDRPNEDLEAASSIIDQLDTVDRDSYAFRYPESKDGQAYLPDLQHINVVHFSKVINSVYWMLSGYHDWLVETYSRHEY